MEFNIIDFNNVKKLWEYSLILDAPFKPKFRDEADGAVALDASTQGASELGSFTLDYSFIDDVVTPMPLTSGEAS